MNDILLWAGITVGVALVLFLIVSLATRKRPRPGNRWNEDDSGRWPS